MNFSEIMDINTTHELKGRTWWWWFWIFFLENEKRRDRTKQLVILWATRNCKKMRVNDHIWFRKREMVRQAGRIGFDGLSASWYFDGEIMHDPLFIDGGEMESRWSENGGCVLLDNGNRYLFKGKNEDCIVKVDRENLNIDFSITPWTPYLSKIVPTGKSYFRHLGYEMRKIRGAKVQGSINLEGKKEEVEGSAYFQKVRINSPTSPWYWGIFHSENGSYIDYFMPHLGPPMLRRRVGHRSLLDWGERFLSRGWQFYDASKEKMHHIRDVKIVKRYQEDLPIFLLKGAEGDRSIEMEMKAYARAYWRVEQPFLGILSTVLFYNEYPANVTRFQFKEGGEITTLKDLGRIVGNCEHAWGMV